MICLFISKDSKTRWLLKKKQTTKKRGIVAIQGKTITLLFTINITTFYLVLRERHWLGHCLWNKWIQIIDLNYFWEEKKGTQQTSYTKLVCWTPSQGVWVQDLTILGQNLLFSQCKSPPRNANGPANCQGSLMKCLIPLVALCKGNWDSLTGWTTCLEYRPFLHKNANISCTLYLQEKYWVLESENHIKSLFHEIPFKDS